MLWYWQSKLFFNPTGNIQKKRNPLYEPSRKPNPICGNVYRKQNAAYGAPPQRSYPPLWLVFHTRLKPRPFGSFRLIRKGNVISATAGVWSTARGLGCLQFRRLGFLFFFRSALPYGQTIRLFGDQQKILPVEFQIIPADGFCLILKFNVQVFFAPQVFRKGNKIFQRMRFQSVVFVMRKPKLKTHCPLKMKRSAAIKKMLDG